MSRRTSAIITCRNYGRFLGQCLDSVLRQSRPFDEILLVDDASGDDTHDIWNAGFRGRVRYERIECRDPMEARNFGVENTRGEYLVHIDADDWLLPAFHDRMLRTLEADPSAGFAYSGYYQVLETAGEKQQWSKPPLAGFDPYRLWRDNYVLQSSLMRRAAWCGGERPYGFREKGLVYGEDWEHWLEIIRRGWSGRLVSQRLFCRRRHGRNLSEEIESSPPFRARAAWQIRKKFLSSDATAILLVPGRRQPEPDFLPARCRLPSGCQVFVVDGSLDPFRRLPLEGDACFRVPFLLHETRQAWKTRCVRTLRPYASGREVLILDTDVSVSGSFAEWSQRRRELKCGIISAGGNGYGMLLMNARAFHDACLDRTDQRPGSQPPLEECLSTWAEENNRLWADCSGEFPAGRQIDAASVPDMCREDTAVISVSSTETGFFARASAQTESGRAGFRFFQKYPMGLAKRYWWMPRTPVELVLRFFKKTALGAGNRNRLDRAVRDFFSEWGYQQELRKAVGAGKASPGGRSYILAAGGSPLRPDSGVFGELWAGAAAARKTVHIDPPRGMLSSWYEALLGLAGGTTVWHWSPELASLGEWRLFPEPRRFPLFRRWNERINFHRCRKALGISAGEGIVLRGERAGRWKGLCSDYKIHEENAAPSVKSFLECAKGTESARSAAVL